MKTEKEKIQAELDEMSPWLSKLKKTNTGDGFEVPTHYFEQLTDKILAQTKTEQVVQTAPKPVAMPWWKTLSMQLEWLFTPRMAYGFASVAILVAAFFWLRPTAQAPIVADVQTTKVVTQEAITSDEAEAYIQSNIDDFDEHTILSVHAADVVEKDAMPKKQPKAQLEDKDLDLYLNKIIKDENLSDKELEDLL